MATVERVQITMTVKQAREWEAALAEAQFGPDGYDVLIPKWVADGLARLRGKLQNAGGAWSRFRLPEQRADLRRLAEAAAEGLGPCPVPYHTDCTCAATFASHSREMAHFRVAANPAVVLALLDEIERRGLLLAIAYPGWPDNDED